VQPQHLDNVLAGLGVGSCSQRDEGGIRKIFPQFTQRRVFGPEIMAPLRNTVGFIDRNQRHGNRIQAMDKTGSHYPFGGDVKQVQFTTVQSGQHRSGLSRTQIGVVHGRVYAVSLQGIYLVFHQRDQWRDHDRQSIAMQGG